MTALKTEIINVTPNMAKAWMAQNNRNRNLSRKKVRTYVADMLSGQWTLHHQGIAFYDNGVLADGQHRLAAVIESGVTVKMMMTTGLPYRIGADIDRHRPRSETDSIRIGGLSDWMGATEIRVIKAIVNAHTDSAGSLSTNELVSWGKALRNGVQFAVKAFHTRKKFLTVAPVVAAMAVAYEHEDQRRLQQFANVLLSGMPLSADDVAAVKLRDALMKHEFGNSSKDRLMVMQKTMRAIKHFCNNERIQRLVQPAHLMYRSDIVEKRLQPKTKKLDGQKKHA